MEGILYREMIKCRQKVGEALLNYRSTLKQYHVLVYIIQISALLYNYLLNLSFLLGSKLPKDLPPGVTLAPSTLPDT